jgi:hypothetical protein
MVQTKRRRGKGKSKMRATKHSRLGGNITTKVIKPDPDKDDLKITYMNMDDLENTISVLATYMFKKMGKSEKIEFLYELNGLKDE